MKGNKKGDFLSVGASINRNENINKNSAQLGCCEEMKSYNCQQRYKQLENPV